MIVAVIKSIDAAKGEGILILADIAHLASHFFNHRDFGSNYVTLVIQDVKVMRLLTFQDTLVGEFRQDGLGAVQLLHIRHGSLDGCTGNGHDGHSGDGFATLVNKVNLDIVAVVGSSLLVHVHSHIEGIATSVLDIGSREHAAIFVVRVNGDIRCDFAISLNGIGSIVKRLIVDGHVETQQVRRNHRAMSAVALFGIQHFGGNRDIGVLDLAVHGVRRNGHIDLNHAFNNREGTVDNGDFIVAICIGRKDRDNIVVANRRMVSNHTQVSASQGIPIHHSRFAVITGVGNFIDSLIIGPVDIHRVTIQAGLVNGSNRDRTLGDGKHTLNVLNVVVAGAHIGKTSGNHSTGANMRMGSGRSTFCISKDERQSGISQGVVLVIMNVKVIIRCKAFENQVFNRKNRVLVAVHAADILGHRDGQCTRSNGKVSGFLRDDEVGIFANHSHLVSANVFTSLTLNMQVDQVGAFQNITFTINNSVGQFRVILTVNLGGCIRAHCNGSSIDRQSRINPLNGVVGSADIVQASGMDGVSANIRTFRNRVAGFQVHELEFTSQRGRGILAALKSTVSNSEIGQRVSICHDIWAIHSNGQNSRVDGQSGDIHFGTISLQLFIGRGHIGQVIVLVVQVSLDSVFTDILAFLTSHGTRQFASSQRQNVNAGISQIAFDRVQRIQRRVGIAVFLLGILEGQSDFTSDDIHGAVHKSHFIVVVTGICCANRILADISGFSGTNASEDQRAVHCVLVIHIQETIPHDFVAGRIENVAISLGDILNRTGYFPGDNFKGIVDQSNVVVLGHRLLVQRAASESIAANILARYAAQNSIGQVSTGVGDVVAAGPGTEIRVSNTENRVRVTEGLLLAGRDSEGHRTAGDEKTIGTSIDVDSVAVFLARQRSDAGGNVVVADIQSRTAVGSDRLAIFRNADAHITDIGNQVTIVVRLGSVNSRNAGNGQLTNHVFGNEVTIDKSLGVGNQGHIAICDNTCAVDNLNIIVGIRLISNLDGIRTLGRRDIRPFRAGRSDIQRAAFRVNNSNDSTLGRVPNRVARSLGRIEDIVFTSQRIAFDDNGQRLDSQDTLGAAGLPLIDDVVVLAFKTGSGDFVFTNRRRANRLMSQNQLAGQGIVCRIGNTEFGIGDKTIVGHAIHHIRVFVAVQLFGIRDDDSQVLLNDFELIFCNKSHIVVFEIVGSFELLNRVGVSADIFARFAGYDTVRKIAFDLTHIGVLNSERSVHLTIGLMLTWRHNDV